MGTAEIKPGQIWHSDDGGDWLVTRTYSELLDLYAVLRRLDGQDEAPRRVKARRVAGGFSLPGFTPPES